MRKLYSRPVFVITASVVALIAILLAPTIVFNLTSRPQRPGAVLQAPSNDVGIVFGSGLRSDGRASRFLADRLDAALTLYNEGSIRHILVSGDNRTVEHNEPAAMSLYLQERGVPAESITEDFGGRSTLDTCNRAIDVFGIESATLITHTYHLPRSIFLCSHFGIDATGVGPESANFANNIRETLSSWKATIDTLVLDTGAEVLGEPEPIIVIDDRV